MNKDNLDKEYQFFKDTKKKLLEKYENKFVVIKDQKILLSCDTLDEGIERAKEKGHKLGTFLVQKVSREDEVIHYYSRVLINAV